MAFLNDTLINGDLHVNGKISLSSGGSAELLKSMLGTSAIGSASQPIYWNGSAFTPGDTINNGTFILKVNGTVVGNTFTANSLSGATYEIPSSYIAGTHSHGNITATGQLGGTRISISTSSSDAYFYMAVVNHTDSNKLIGTNVGFNSGNSNYFLAQNGSWQPAIVSGCVLNESNGDYTPALRIGGTHSATVGDRLIMCAGADNTTYAENTMYASDISYSKLASAGPYGFNVNVSYAAETTLATYANYLTLSGTNYSPSKFLLSDGSQILTDYIGSTGETGWNLISTTATTSTAAVLNSFIITVCINSSNIIAASVVTVETRGTSYKLSAKILSSYTNGWNSSHSFYAGLIYDTSTWKGTLHVEHTNGSGTASTTTYSRISIFPLYVSSSTTVSLSSMGSTSKMSSYNTTVQITPTA